MPVLYVAANNLYVDYVVAHTLYVDYVVAHTLYIDYVVAHTLYIDYVVAHIFYVDAHTFLYEPYVKRSLWAVLTGEFKLVLLLLCLKTCGGWRQLSLAV